MLKKKKNALLLVLFCMLIAYSVSAEQAVEHTTSDITILGIGHSSDINVNILKVLNTHPIVNGGNLLKKETYGPISPTPIIIYVKVDYGKNITVNDLTLNIYKFGDSTKTDLLSTTVNLGNLYVSPLEDTLKVGTDTFQVFTQIYRYQCSLPNDILTSLYYVKATANYSSLGTGVITKSQDVAITKVIGSDSEDDPIQERLDALKVITCIPNSRLVHYNFSDTSATQNTPLFDVYQVKNTYKAINFSAWNLNINLELNYTSQLLDSDTTFLTDDFIRSRGTGNNTFYIVMRSLRATETWSYDPTWMAATREYWPLTDGYYNENAHGVISGRPMRVLVNMPQFNFSFNVFNDNRIAVLGSLWTAGMQKQARENFASHTAAHEIGHCLGINYECLVHHNKCVMMGVFNGDILATSLFDCDPWDCTDRERHANDIYRKFNIIP